MDEELEVVDLCDSNSEGFDSKAQNEIEMTENAVKSLDNADQVEIDMGTSGSVEVESPDVNNDNVNVKKSIHITNFEALKKLLFIKQYPIYIVLIAVIASLYITLYGSAMWQPSDRLHNLNVLLVNNDEGLDCSTDTCYGDTTLDAIAEGLFSSAGDSFVAMIKANAGSVFEWNYWSNVDIDEVTDEIEDSNYWFAIVIPADYSRNHLNALSVSNSETYSNSLEFIYDGGYNYNTKSSYVKAVDTLMDSLTAGAGDLIEANASFDSFKSYVKPSFWRNVFTVNATDLHPVKYYGQNFLTYIIPVVFMICGMMNVSVVMKLSFGPEGQSLQEYKENGSRATMAFVIGRVLYVPPMSLVQSLLAWCVLMVLGAETEYSWFYWILWAMFWNLTFTGISGVLCALIGYDLFPVPNAIFLILNLTSSAGILSEEVMYSFFKIGRVLPMYYFVQGNRCIMFGSNTSLLIPAILVGLTYFIVCAILIFFLGKKNTEKRWDSLLESPYGSVLAMFLPARTMVPA
eukprot:TRINITY_DN3518_c0_g2_i1.p1 TRINITY_DN3518_c0_g2~~TRINITY_DN3518_c0_g2_i1.p1  ORF type:complete len:516 (-),score=112.55 TRINITY_DN3518_c0_g2_i1:305-1852(-)